MSTPFYSPSESPFLNQVRRTIRLKHMSRRTEKSYLYYILDYIYFHHKRHPQDMGVEEIRSYFCHVGFIVGFSVIALTLYYGFRAIEFI